ncbi:MAG: LUD domain-containing protein [Gemmatimonadaceae bacterium]
MTDARDDMLGKVRRALADVPPEERATQMAVPRAYRLRDETPWPSVVARFAERVTEYGARVRRVPQEALASEIARACSERGVRRLVVPTDLPERWLPPAITVLCDDAASTARLDNATLDGSDGVLTGCAICIAQTGTIALDGGARQGRRAITLLPDYHLCVVFAEQIVSLVPEAVTRLGASVRATRRPVTFISGPSATSDIELSRVAGVYGPRTLEVVLVG